MDEKRVIFLLFKFYTVGKSHLCKISCFKKFSVKSSFLLGLTEIKVLYKEIYQPLMDILCKFWTFFKNSNFLSLFTKKTIFTEGSKFFKFKINKKSSKNYLHSLPKHMCMPSKMGILKNIFSACMRNLLKYIHKNLCLYVIASHDCSYCIKYDLW